LLNPSYHINFRNSSAFLTNEYLLDFADLDKVSHLNLENFVILGGLKIFGFNCIFLFFFVLGIGKYLKKICIEKSI